MNRNRKQIYALMAFPDNFQGIFNDLKTSRFLYIPLPRLLSAARDCTGMKFYILIFKKPKVQRLDEFVHTFDQMKYLTLKYGNATENKILLIRIFDRPRAVDIKEVHIFPGMRGIIR